MNACPMKGETYFTWGEDHSPGCAKRNLEYNADSPVASMVPFLEGPFPHQKQHPKPDNRPIVQQLTYHLKYLPWSDPSPKHLAWCSAPGASIRDCRGMRSQDCNLPRMSICQGRYILPPGRPHLPPAGGCPACGRTNDGRSRVQCLVPAQGAGAWHWMNSAPRFPATQSPGTP